MLSRCWVHSSSVMNKTVPTFSLIIASMTHNLCLIWGRPLFSLEALLPHDHSHPTLMVLHVVGANGNSEPQVVCHWILTCLTGLPSPCPMFLSITCYHPIDISQACVFTSHFLGNPCLMRSVHCALALLVYLWHLKQYLRRRTSNVSE